MAVPCEFGDSLSESLKVVCGLRNESHQKRLLSKPELALDTGDLPESGDS